MTTKNRCYEQMTLVSICGYRVRVWTTIKSLIEGPDLKILRLAEKLNKQKFVTILFISKELSKFEDIAAYEILDSNGCGIVVYPDWGNE